MVMDRWHLDESVPIVLPENTGEGGLKMNVRKVGLKIHVRERF